MNGAAVMAAGFFILFAAITRLPLDTPMWRVVLYLAFGLMFIALIGPSLLMQSLFGG